VLGRWLTEPRDPPRSTRSASPPSPAPPADQR
jgi:hypothetical protein